jgi:hypothetical protein
MRILYTSYDGMLEPFGQSQVLGYGVKTRFCLKENLEG